MTHFTEILKYAAAAGIFLGLVFFLYAAFSWADERSVARQSLKVLEDYDNAVVKKLREIRKPSASTLGSKAVEYGRRLTSSEREKKTREKLTLAGRPTKDDLDRYLAMKLMFAIVAAVWLLLFFFAVPFVHGKLQWLIAIAGAVGFFQYPDINVNHLKEARQSSIRRSLPDVLDVLTISVEAGLGFEQAVDQVVQSIKGPLADEFYRMLSETRAGATRSEALRAIDERVQIPELKSFISAIVQADRFGVTIAGILRSQAEEMRIKRRQLAQEKAQKLPVKMLIPMTLCIFPALMIVMLGPAAINVYRNLG